MGAGPKRKAATATAFRARRGCSAACAGCSPNSLLEALRFVPGSRIEQTARQWLARCGLPEDDPRGLLVMADAIGFASDLALFTPSPSGATAVDRLLRNRPVAGGDEAAAAEALRRAQFRLLRVEAQEGEGAFRLRDLASGEALRVLDDSMPPDCVGLPLAARLAPMGDGRHVFAGPATPLDDAALAVAQGFIRPGGRGLSNALRCAEAVYRHVVRHGGPEIPGLNRPPEDGLDEDAFPIGPEDSELDALAHGWAELEPGTEPPPDEVQMARSLAGPAAIMEALVASAMARDWDRDRLADAYARVALLQMETLQLREATGIFAGRLDAVAAAIDRAIADVDLPPSVRALFDTLRLRIGVAPSGGQGFARRRPRPAGAADPSAPRQDGRPGLHGAGGARRGGKGGGTAGPPRPVAERTRAPPAGLRGRSASTPGGAGPARSTTACPPSPSSSTAASGARRPRPARCGTSSSAFPGTSRPPTTCTS